jgi:DNA-binding Lrp family transcriptional regulator
VRHAELKLVCELLKNSRRSDRELALAIGVSQPTVSRIIKRLKEEGVIREYTMIPDFAMLGYEIMALTLLNINPAANKQDVEKVLGLTKEEFSSIIMLEEGLGLGHTGVIMSVHKSYSDYSRFIQDFKKASLTANVQENLESFLINLNDKVHCYPLTLRALADHILRKNDQKE